ncbi:MAG: hypothetical protein TH68_10020 [Candidatus Synechococcus spongiarum 142]|uniref:Ribbon-helix-helix protein CopG domain-containing protein n=1 Tax=Candidatus Synechococcus spongiarum 142 TaxID=1608213 RepID=A0A6N3X1R7_9SYNE|nr:MAG: hypothetical protein TH68_10020 [Candidatus Synechococcus spongiarum 142]
MSIKELPIYEVRMDPQMDKDMGQLAKRLGKHRAEVFHRAMRLYIAVKNQQLDQEDRNPESPLRVFLEDAQGSKTEVVGL